MRVRRVVRLEPLSTLDRILREIIIIVEIAILRARPVMGTEILSVILVKLVFIMSQLIRALVLVRQDIGRMM